MGSHRLRIGPTAVGWRANEPGGYAEIFDTGFTTLTEDGWVVNSGSPGLGTDAGAPQSPSSYAYIPYDIGLLGGYSDGDMGNNHGTSLSSIYICWYMRITTGFDYHGVTNKLFIPDGAFNNIVVSFKAEGSGYQVRTSVQNVTPTDLLDQNVQLVECAENEWYLFEILMDFGTDETSDDGTYEQWVSEVKTSSHTNVDYFDSAGWYCDNFKWTGIWGGIGDTVDTDGEVQIDHIYVSGVAV
jgi:hypothetical protein